MTTCAADLQSALNRPLRRFSNALRTLFAPGDFTALLIVFGMVLLPILALEAAGWPLAVGTVLPVAAVAVGLGFLLARSHYGELLALILSVLYGAGVTLLVAAVNEPGGLIEGINSVAGRLASWVVAVFTGGINQDELVFTLLLALLLWFVGYSAAWHIFRIDRVWRAVLPPGLLLVTNSLYYTGDANLDAYLIAFVFLALLLVVRSHLDAREWEWYINGIRVPRKLRQQFFRVGALLALVVLLAAWLIPSGNLQSGLDRFQAFLQTDPLTQLSELWNRLFASADTQGPATADYYGGDSLQLGGAIRLGDQTVLLVEAPPANRYYWRSRVFDTYENGRWLPAANTRLTDPQSPLQVLVAPFPEGARLPVQQTFTMALSASRLIYTAPQPYRVERPTRTDLLYIDAAGSAITNPQSEQLPASMNVSVIRPLQVLNQGDSYTATSLLSAASAGQLRAAGTDYPDWVRGLYFYVSPSVTDRTLALAREIVAQAGAVTPYDQARAVESWLRANVLYNESIPQPPPGRDPVDWMLFDLREGYCNYYASAMIMMLRGVGVPARMAAGFAQGRWDADSQRFVVLERDAHTWVEVYFPGYGWVEFEPTAAQAPISRVDDQPQNQQPTPTPPQTATPTPTATPSTTPTLNPSVFPAEGRTLPTLTPTPTPSPTPTPVIVPTQPPPQMPQASSPLPALLRILGMIALGLFLLLLAAALLIFIWWWWEWRGMRGLSPVARAYARLERYVPLVGLRLGSEQTPDERRRRIVRVLPPAEPPVTAITHMYTAERYGPRRRHPAEAEAQQEIADEAWTDARGSILRRFLARLLPWNRRG